jgi:hypothetical protein
LDARIEFGTARGQTYILLVPQHGSPYPKLEGSSTHSSLEQSKQSKIDQYQKPFPQRDPMTVSLEGAIQLDGGHATYTVTGDFVLAVWDWDATITHSGGTTEVKSGEESTELVPGAGPVRGVEQVEFRQVYYFVTDGELTFTVQQPEDVFVYVDSGSMTVQGSLVLHDAVGRLAVGGGRAVLGDDVELSGDLRLDFGASKGDRIPVVPSGKVERATVAGAAVPLADGGLPWMWIAAAAILVLVGGRYALNPLLRRRMEDAFNGNDHARVWGLGRWLFSSRRYGKDAAMMATISMIQAHRPERALQLLARDKLWAGDGFREYLYASAMANDSPDEAREWVHKCLSRNPEFEGEIRGNVALAGFIGGRDERLDVT